MSQTGSSSEEGSALLIALFGIVVLTILGLFLSVITQTEMRLGMNERTLQRVFYAADSGFGASVSRALVEADYTSKTFALADPGSKPGLEFRHQIDVSPFLPILNAPCNLCEINNSGTYGTKQYLKVSHAVAAEAGRHGGGIGSPGITALKTLSSMIDIQPTESTPEAFLALEDPEQLAKIRF